jgi:hypothetical protein
MALLPIFALTVYQEDDTTPLFTVSTDPAHANPYLKAFENFPEQEVDFAKGAASIGQQTVRIVDVPTDPTDQSTGWMTAQLPDGGYSALMGHRAVTTQDIGAGAEIILEGVVRSVVLLDTWSTYELELRDIRERERKTKAFTRTDTPTVLPRGVLDGYGVSFSIFGISTTFPVPPTAPCTGTYLQRTTSQGEIHEIFQPPGQPIGVLTLTAPMADALNSVAPIDDEKEVLVYDRWKLLWRDKATGGAYTTLTQVAARHSGLQLGQMRLLFNISSQGQRTGVSVGTQIDAIGINNVVSGGTLPSDQQEIEFIIQYDGPVTEDWRLHLQGLTVGEFLRNGYRGDYSDEPPRIRYDEASLLAFSLPIRATIGKPVDDLRDYFEKHAYPIIHAAPTLNADGEISPVTYLLPPDGVTLPHLDNDNCAPEGGGWAHASQDAINLVVVKYKRDYAINPEDAPNLAPSDLLQAKEIEHDFPLQESIDLLGEEKLEVNSDLLRTIGTKDGGPLGGDATDETGYHVARKIARMATDRFVQGGQYFRLRGMRTDSDVEALGPGSWVTVGVSWMPDYLLGTRGLARMAQVVGRRNLNAAWCSLTLIDAGSANAPLAQPTLGTVTADAAGVVSIPVTALGSGGEARVDYAVSATEPAATSGLWMFLDRVDSVPTTLTTPPLLSGATVWVRPRSENLGRRPSAWGSAVSVVIGTQARLLNVAVTLDEFGVPTVSWVPNADCLGVQVTYDVHDRGTLATLGSATDVDASDLQLELSAERVRNGQVITVQVEPYTGFSGGSVAGTAGPAVELRVVSHSVPFNDVFPGEQLTGTNPTVKGSLDVEGGEGATVLSILSVSGGHVTFNDDGGVQQAVMGYAGSPVDEFDLFSDVAVRINTQANSEEIALESGADLTLDADSNVIMPSLPTSDPSVAGALWIDTSAGRVLKVSAG